LPSDNDKWLDRQWEATGWDVMVAVAVGVGLVAGCVGDAVTGGWLCDGGGGFVTGGDPWGPPDELPPQPVRASSVAAPSTKITFRGFTSGTLSAAC
jgi:hypothetical protein